VQEIDKMNKGTIDRNFINVFYLRLFTSGYFKIIIRC